MKLLKKIARFFLFATLLAVAILIIVISGYSIQYKRIVKKKPGNLEKPFEPGELGKWVDPFTGTGGFPTYTSGDVIPGATVPFGMVRLSPDTKSNLPATFAEKNTISTAGYYYGANRIMGFSHTRLIGTGAAEGGHFRILPVNGESGFKKIIKEKFPKFSHENEIAFPGYYAVKFHKQNILAELTASKRVGFHRYTFQGKQSPHILINVSSTLGNGRTEEGEVFIYPEDQKIEGAIKTFGSFGGRYGGVKIYFSARTNQPFFSFGVWSDEEFFSNKNELKGNNIGVDIGFQKSSTEQVIELQLGISYVSLENARENLESENKPFNEIYYDARDAWEEKFSLIKIEGDDSEKKEIFYSALYRSFQMPTIFNDVNGEYRGFDKKVHKTNNFRYFTDMSLWDTFRTIHPLFNLIARKEQRDMMVSLVKMSEQGGVLPLWPSGYGYTGSMLGASADIVISEAYQKGIKNFEVEKAYQAMKKVALGNIPDQGFKPRSGIKEYLEYQYCPAELMTKAVSRTLEYAYADYCISKLAEKLGYEEDAQLFRNHAMYYKNVWNPETQYFHPRKTTGEFVEEFRPLKLTYFDFDGEYTNDYVEGSALLITSKRLSKETYSAQLIINTLRCLLFRTTLDNL